MPKPSPIVLDSDTKSDRPDQLSSSTVMERLGNDRYLAVRLEV
ncbi:MAG: hypothetical protein ACO31I_14760 [Prochlorotrichaceae cyanobacterium]